jgi:hypothetical protein
MKRSVLFAFLLLLGCHRNQAAPKSPAKAPESAPVASAPLEPASAPVVVAEAPAAPPVLSEPAPPVPVEAPAPLVPPAEMPAPSQPAPPAAPPVPLVAPKPIDEYDRLLKTYVSGGKVDYAGLSKERAALDSFLKSVEKAPGKPTLAFYLNAYNATVLGALLDEKLPGKVTDVKGFFDSKKHTLAGKNQTLNDLETYIRTTYKDPRVHFALNCGARSCPPLYTRAFRDSTSEKVLSDLTAKFLNGGGVKIDDSAKQIKVTRLMDWYGKDFVEKEGSVEAYLKLWVTDKTKNAALVAGLSAGYKVSFQDYDWSLNKK